MLSVYIIVSLGRPYIYIHTVWSDAKSTRKISYERVTIGEDGKTWGGVTATIQGV